MLDNGTEKNNTQNNLLRGMAANTMMAVNNQLKELRTCFQMELSGGKIRSCETIKHFNHSNVCGIHTEQIHGTLYLLGICYMLQMKN